MPPRARKIVLAVACAAAVLGGADAALAGRWKGLTVSGKVAKDAEQYWQTPRLSPGSYQFVLSGSGDADLYVRIGSAPTLTAYDCRPARAEPNKTCFVQLAQDAVVHFMVRGFAPMTAFKVVGRAARPR
jgi:hypothetical protein